MNRAPIPPPPTVVGGMLSKNEPSKLRRGSSGGLVGLVNLNQDLVGCGQIVCVKGACSPVPVDRAIAPARSLSDPPVLSYMDEKWSLNGL